MMKATQFLHSLGQSLWLNNITRSLLDDGTLKDYLDELSVSSDAASATTFRHSDGTPARPSRHAIMSVGQATPFLT